MVALKPIARTLFALGMATLALQCQDREAPLSLESSSGGLETARESHALKLIEALLEGDVEEKAVLMFKEIRPLRSSGDLGGARRVTFRLIELLLSRHEHGKLEDPQGGSPPTTEEALAFLIARLLEFVGLATDPIPPGAFDEDGAFASCGPGGCVVVTGTEFAGVVIPPGALDHPIFIAISRLPNSPGPLPTGLDQYPLFYEFIIYPDGDLNSSLETVGPSEAFAADVSVALCVLDDPPHSFGAPPSAVPDLALAHPDSTGNDIEILPPGPSGFIDCTDANTTALRTGPWSRFVATLFRPLTPALLLAMPGGVGGQASSFSPFGAVDTTSGGPIATTTTLDAEPDTVSSGTPDTLKATVSPAPLLSESPTVLFFDGADTLGVVAPNGSGVAVLIVGTGLCPGPPCLAPGSHSLTAEFTGTPSHAPSTSPPVPVLVLFPLID
jgi:hypothetical protein